LNRKSGFTMIEVIVIVAVLAILAGIITPLAVREVGKSKVARAKSDMETISTGLNQYFVDTSFWPDQWNGTGSSRSDMLTYTSLYANTLNLSGWDGPYLEKGVRNGNTLQMTLGAGAAMTGIIDPWGTPFQIVYGAVGANGAGAAGVIALVSAGPNKVHNTTDVNARAGVAQGDDIVKIVTRRAR
jgi:prepilin-type N-terminal cleavage/methylation domain-containing protein